MADDSTGITVLQGPPAHLAQNEDEGIRVLSGPPEGIAVDGIRPLAGPPPGLLVNEQPKIAAPAPLGIEQPAPILPTPDFRPAFEAAAASPAVEQTSPLGYLSTTAKLNPGGMSISTQPQIPVSLKDGQVVVDAPGGKQIPFDPTPAPQTDIFGKPVPQPETLKNEVTPEGLRNMAVKLEGMASKRFDPAQFPATPQQVVDPNETATLSRWANARNAFARSAISSTLQPAQALAKVDEMLFERRPEFSGEEVAKGRQEVLEQMQAAARETYPLDPRYSGEFLASQLPQGAGSLLPFVLSGTLGGPVASAALGSLLSAQQEYENARAAGADEATARKALGIGALIGTTEALGAGKAGAAVKAGGRTLLGAAKEIGKEMVEEGGQEVFQDFLSVLNAAHISKYDPNKRAELSDTLKTFAVGAVLGGAVKVPGITAEVIAEAKASKDPAATLEQAIAQVEQRTQARQSDIANTETLAANADELGLTEAATRLREQAALKRQEFERSLTESEPSPTSASQAEPATSAPSPTPAAEGVSPASQDVQPSVSASAEPAAAELPTQAPNISPEVRTNEAPLAQPVDQAPEVPAPTTQAAADAEPRVGQTVESGAAPTPLGDVERPANLRETAGWKLHLASADPEAVSAVLKELGLRHKVGRSDGQAGKDVTVYVGGKHAADRAARLIEEKAGSLLKDPEGEALADDTPFTSKVVGRFDAAGDPDFHQYGSGGVPDLNDDVNNAVFGGDAKTSEQRREAADRLLRQRYGKFYSGTPRTDLGVPAATEQSLATTPAPDTEADVFSKVGVVEPTEQPEPESDLPATSQTIVRNVVVDISRRAPGVNPDLISGELRKAYYEAQAQKRSAGAAVAGRIDPEGLLNQVAADLIKNVEATGNPLKTAGGGEYSGVQTVRSRVVDEARKAAVRVEGQGVAPIEEGVDAVQDTEQGDGVGEEDRPEVQGQIRAYLEPVIGDVVNASFAAGKTVTVKGQAVEAKPTAMRAAANYLVPRVLALELNIPIEVARQIFPTPGGKPSAQQEALQNDPDFYESVKASVLKRIAEGSGRNRAGVLQSDSRAEGEPTGAGRGMGRQVRGVEDIRRAASIRTSAEVTQLAESLRRAERLLTPDQFKRMEFVSRALLPAETRAFLSEREEQFALNGTVRESLTAISKNGQTQMQALAKAILNKNEAWLDRPVEMRWWMESGGEYSPRLDKISINPLVSAGLTETNLAHEVVHQILYGKVKAFQSGDLSALSEAEVEALGDLDQQYLTALAAAPEEIQAIASEPSDSARADAWDEYTAGLTTEQLNEAQAYFYGLTSLQEFSAEVATNPDFQKWLNQIPSQGKTKAKLKTLWQAVKETVARIVGIEPTSVAGRALESVLDLLQQEGRVDREGTRLRSPRMQERADEGFGATESAPSFTPTVFTADDRRESQSLARARESKLMPAAVREALENRTYLKDTYKEDFSQADAWIEKAGGPEEAIAVVDNDVYNRELSTTQKQAVKLVAYKSIQEALRRLKKLPKSELSPQVLDLTDRYTSLMKRAALELAEQATVSAQGLRFAREIADQLGPVGLVSQYTGPIEVVQDTVLGSDPTVKTIVDALDNGRAAGAGAAVDALRPALTKAGLAGSGVTEDEAGQLQLFFEGWDTLVKNYNPTSATPVLEQIKKAAVEHFVKSFAKQSGVKQQAALEILSNQVRAQVQEAVNRLTKVEKEAGAEPTAVEIAQKLGELFQRTELAEDVFNRTVEGLRAKRGGVSVEERAAIDEFLAKNPKFDAGQLNKVVSAVRKLVDFKAEAKKFIGGRRTTKENLAAFLRAANPSLSEKQADLLADAARATFDAEVKIAAGQALDSLQKANETVREIVDKPMATRLLEFAAMGGIQREALFNLLAPKWNLPTWSQEIADELQAEAEKVGELPEGSVMKDEAAQKLMSRIAQLHLKGAWQKGGMERLGVLARVGSSVWSAGTLSGIPTQATNTSMSAVSVLLDATMAASGNALSARKKQKASLKEVLPFFTDIFRGYGALVGQGNRFDKVWNSKAFLEARNAIASGTTTARARSQQALPVLEGFTGKNPLALYKYVGRVMAAADAANSMIAADARQIMFARYAALEKGLTGKALQETMDKVFDKTREARQWALDQVALEEEQGHFSAYTGKDLARVKARRANQLVEERVFTPEAIEAGRKFAQEATFNSEPVGIVGMVGSFWAKLNDTIGVSRVLIPYPITLANMVTQAMRYSPLGFAYAHNWNLSKAMDKTRGKRFTPADIEIGSPEYYQALSRATFGTALFSAFAAMVFAGLDDDDPEIMLTGAGPKDFNQRKQLEQSGAFQANSLKVGSKWYRYTDWPGVSMALGVLGKFADGVRYDGMKEKDAVDQLTMASFGLVNALLGKSMLNGLADAAKIISDDPREASSAAKRLTASAVSGVTNPGLVRWINQSLPGKDGEVVLPDRYLFESWLYSMSPISAANPNKAFNVLGEEIKNPWWDPTTKRFVSFKDIQEQHPKIAPLVKAGVYLPVATKFEVKEKGAKKERKMTDEEYYRYAKYYGEALNKALTPEAVTRIVKMAAKDKETAQEYIANQYGTRARQIAKRRFLKEEKK